MENYLSCQQISDIVAWSNITKFFTPYFFFALTTYSLHATTLCLWPGEKPNAGKYLCVAIRGANVTPTDEKEKLLQRIRELEHENKLLLESIRVPLGCTCAGGPVCKIHFDEEVNTNVDREMIIEECGKCDMTDCGWCRLGEYLRNHPQKPPVLFSYIVSFRYRSHGKYGSHYTEEVQGSDSRHAVEELINEYLPDEIVVEKVWVKHPRSSGVVVCEGKGCTSLIIVKNGHSLCSFCGLKEHH